MSLKNPLIPSGIEPVNFRFVAQHLNHCATAVPALYGVMSENVIHPERPDMTMQYGACALYAG